MIDSDKAQKVKGVEKSAPVATEKGYAVENLEAWGDWRTEALDDTLEVIFGERSIFCERLLFDAQYQL